MELSLSELEITTGDILVFQRVKNSPELKLASDYYQHILKFPALVPKGIYY